MADLVQVGGAKYRRSGDGWLVTGEARECAVGPKMCSMLDRIAELEAAHLPPVVPVVTVTDEMVERGAKAFAFRLIGCTEKGWRGTEVFSEEDKQRIRDDVRVVLTAAYAAQASSSPAGDTLRPETMGTEGTHHE